MLVCVRRFGVLKMQMTILWLRMSPSLVEFRSMMDTFGRMRVILDRMSLSEVSVTEIGLFCLIVSSIFMMHVSDRRPRGRVRSWMVSNRSSRCVAVIVIVWRVRAIPLHFKVARRCVNLILTIDLLAKSDSLHGCKHKCCLKKLHFSRY